jgi:CBASS immunity sensor of nucleotide second messenger signals
MLIYVDTSKQVTAFSLGWASGRRSASKLISLQKVTSGPATCILEPDTVHHFGSALLDDRLVVGIGILRSPGADIRKHLDVAGDRNLLLLNLPQALADGAEAQALVQIVKNAIAAAAADFRTPAIDLYYVGPAAFAVALGHRWNGLPATQLHEFVQAEGKYVPTAIT